MTDLAPHRTRRDWLLDESPASRLQARLGRLYRLALALTANPLTVVGAAIVVLLVVMAIFAPVDRKSVV